jgi:hypothetical protein
LGALLGGIAAITDPDSPMGMSVDMLRISPFKNFLIPGIVLFGLIGVGNLAALFLSFKKPQLKGYGAGFMGGALIFWIIIQCIMLQAVGFLHVLFFVFGSVQGISAILILSVNRQFPIPTVIKIVKKLSLLISTED